MFLALYIALIIAVFIPFSLLLRFIIMRLGIDAVLQEIRELSDKASKLSPKDKKMRMIRSRYEFLKRRLRNVFLANLFILWMAIFTAITVSNSIVIMLASNYGVVATFRSPIKLPILVLGEDQLNIFLVIMAVIMAYQPLHNKLSTMEKIYEA
ncbi:MAG: hypothetical protein QW133_01300 [Sulfolobales archaeon]